MSIFPIKINRKLVSLHPFRICHKVHDNYDRGRSAISLGRLHVSGANREGGGGMK